MSIIKFMTAEHSQSQAGYNAPETRIMDVQSEGLLCASGANGATEDYTDGEFDWN